MKLRIMFFSLVILFLVTGSVQADIGVWTFDELPGGDVPGPRPAVPNGYGGLNWENMYYLDASSLTPGETGYVAGMVSPTKVAFNGWGEPAAVSDGIFSFGGTYLTGAFNEGLNVQVDGYLDGSLIYSQTVVVSSTTPTWFNFNYYSIDRLEFSSWGGIPNPDYANHGFGTQFVMDNFTIVPVPGAVLLGILGLSAVGVKLRKFA